MQAERPTRVNLKQPLTVVLFYDTVHVNSEGVVFFVDDIYGHDRTLDAALVRLTDQTLRARLGRSARDRAVADYSWRAHCEQVDARLQILTRR